MQLVIPNPSRSKGRAKARGTRRSPGKPTSKKEPIMATKKKKRTSSRSRPRPKSRRGYASRRGFALSGVLETSIATAVGSVGAQFVLDRLPPSMAWATTGNNRILATAGIGIVGGMLLRKFAGGKWATGWTVGALSTAIAQLATVYLTNQSRISGYIDPGHPGVTGYLDSSNPAMPGTSESIPFAAVA